MQFHLLSLESANGGALMSGSVKTAAVILAAGSGTRMESSVPKQFMRLLGIPVFLHSVRKFDSVAEKIVLVTSAEYIDYCNNVLKAAKLEAQWTVVAGGNNRIDSSMNGVAAAGDCDIIMIHDAARVCVSRDVIFEALCIAKEKGTAVAAVALKDTIKHALSDGRVLDTPPRSEYSIVQTPQAFRREIISEAYEALAASRTDHSKITDDSMAVELFTEHPVFLSRGSYENIKLTTPEDMAVAESILKRQTLKQ